MFSTITFYAKVFKASVLSFVSEDMLNYAAAISYYMVFSLPSMLLIVLWSAAHFYRENEIHAALFEKISSLVGDAASTMILSTIEKLSIKEPTLLATIVGVGTLLFFATTVFDAMRTALNKIDKVESSDSLGKNVWIALRVRLIAFALLVSISFLLLVSLAFDMILTALSYYLTQWIGDWSQYILIFNIAVVDFAVTTVIFALDFRYLPDTRLKWRDVFVGALLTAALFTLGKGIIGMFIANNQVVDLYDAAGSILALMLWVYYAAIMFLFGASFTFNRVKMKEAKIA